ncbi:MAG: hypothetical protein Q4C54_06950 [Clostridia bacterium]|nr:hypothetical protein [Clostridia bacterium]
MSMPFDPKRVEVFSLWKELSLQLIYTRQVELEPYIPDIDALCHQADLETLENSYRLYDLLYYFAERFDQTVSQRLITERKMVSALMMQLLQSTRLSPKTCRKCHRPIAWNSPYRICRHCAEARR